MTKQEIREYNIDTAYFETDENAFICAACGSPYSNLKDLETHFKENGYLIP